MVLSIFGGGFIISRCMAFYAVSVYLLGFVSFRASVGLLCVCSVAVGVSRVRSGAVCRFLCGSCADAGSGSPFGRGLPVVDALRLLGVVSLYEFGRVLGIICALFFGSSGGLWAWFARRFFGFLFGSFAASSVVIVLYYPRRVSVPLSFSAWAVFRFGLSVVVWLSVCFRVFCALSVRLFRYKKKPAPAVDPLRAVIMLSLFPYLLKNHYRRRRIYS